MTQISPTLLLDQLDSAKESPVSSLVGSQNGSFVESPLDSIAEEFVATESKDGRRNTTTSSRPSLRIEVPSIDTDEAAAPLSPFSVAVSANTRQRWVNCSAAHDSAVPGPATDGEQYVAEDWPYQGLPGLPLPQPVLNTLKISTLYFPETMLLSSSLSIETIRSYSRKMRMNSTDKVDPRSAGSGSVSSTGGLCPGSAYKERLGVGWSPPPSPPELKKSFWPFSRKGSSPRDRSNHDRSPSGAEKLLEGVANPAMNAGAGAVDLVTNALVLTSSCNNIGVLPPTSALSTACSPQGTTSMPTSGNGSTTNNSNALPNKSGNNSKTNNNNNHNNHNNNNLDPAFSPTATVEPANWMVLSSVFVGGSDYLCDALYAHIVAYNYIGTLLKRGVRLVEVRSFDPNNRLCATSQPASPPMDQLAAITIPKKAATLLGLSDIVSPGGLAAPADSKTPDNNAGALPTAATAATGGPRESGDTTTPSNGPSSNSASPVILTGAGALASVGSAAAAPGQPAATVVGMARTRKDHRRDTVGGLVQPPPLRPTDDDVQRNSLRDLQMALHDCISRLVAALRLGEAGKVGFGSLCKGAQVPLLDEFLLRALCEIVRSSEWEGLRSPSW